MMGSGANRPLITRENIEYAWRTTESRVGWDFSRMRISRTPVTWVYEEVVRSLLSGEERVLDIGTGGGEKLIGLADVFGSAVGIDVDPMMIAAAERNTPPALADRLFFQIGSAVATALPDSSFDVVLNRHAVVDVDEFSRVLKKGGFFVSQQVGDNNLFKLLEPFGGQNFDSDQHPVEIRSQLEQSGFSIVRFEEYDVEYRYLDIESVLFQIKAIGHYLLDVADDDSIVDRLEQVLSSTRDGSGGFASNEHRWLIVARKGE